MRIHRLQSPFLGTYEFSGTTLAEVEQAKYLGITVNDKLDWEAQADNITRKASNTLNFLKRNLKYCRKQCKKVAYLALVRSTVEYGYVVWDPHTIKKRKTKSKESTDVLPGRSVMTMVATAVSPPCSPELAAWATLEQRRENQRLTMMYKVVHELVAVPTTHLTVADSRTRANHSYKFRTFSCNSTTYKYSFFPRTIPSWNLLPAETAEATPVDAFKHRFP